MKTYALHSHFKPAGERSVIPSYDPKDYHKLGTEFSRGDARRVMSRGELVEFSKCPQRWKLGVSEDSTSSTEWGSLIDCIVTGDFENTYAIAPETYEKKGMKCEGCDSITDSSKCAKCKRERVPVTFQKPWDWASNTCSDWKKEREAEGKQVIRSNTASEARKAIARINQDEKLSAFIEASKRQVFVRVDYEDEDTGIVVPVKCLLDFVPDPLSEFGTILGDLKTTISAAPRSWLDTVFKRGYHIQAALYLDAYNAATGSNYTQFAHIVQENFAPYETARRVLDAEFIQLGRAAYRRALVDYCWCLANDKWPGFDDWNAGGGDLIDGWRVVSPAAWMIGGEL